MPKQNPATNLVTSCSKNFLKIQRQATKGLIFSLLMASPLMAAAQSSSKAPLVNCKGKVKSFIEDHLLEDSSVINYEVSCGRKKFKLELDKDHKIIPSGALVQVRGRKTDKANVLKISASDSQTGLLVLSSQEVALTGQRTALIIRVNSQDGTVPCSESQLAGYMWSNSVNVSSVFSKASYGTFSFRPDGDGNGAADVITVSIPYNTAGACNYGTWGSAANTEAGKLVTLSNFQHLMYVLPNNVNCGWAGLAGLNANYSYYHGGNCTWQPELFQHELGHNIGLHHSGTPSGGEYADHSCGMGNPGGPVTFNAAKRTEQNWIPAGNIASGVGNYRLKNILNAPGSGEISTVKVPVGTTGENFFVAYRQKGSPEEAGLNSNYDQKVTITRSRGLGSISYQEASLGVGQSFVHSTSGVSFTVLAIDPIGQTADVSITGDCAAAAPQISLSPATVATNSLASKAFNVTVVNNDSIFCQASAFSLSAQVPAGWSASPSSPSITVNAGQSGSAVITITPAASATAASYPVVASASRNGQAISAQGNFVIDLTSPNPPTSVAAKVSYKGKKPQGVNVTCSGSSDAGSPQSGIAGHRIFRNGILACQVNGSSCYDAVTTTGTYIYTCSSFDLAGNVSNVSSASATAVISGSGTGKR